jgi:hypothetical protein
VVEDPFIAGYDPGSIITRITTFPDNVESTSSTAEISVVFMDISDT